MPRVLKNYLSFTSTRTAEGEAVSFGGLNIISTLAWGLGYFGMPHILLRFMAIDDKNKVKISRRIASVWVVLAMGVAVFIGIIGNALTANGTVAPLETSSKAETIVLEMATVLSKHSVGAALIAGLIFAGILACTMSTSDSQLLAASSSMSENLLKGVFHVKLSENAVHDRSTCCPVDYRRAGHCASVGSEQFCIPRSFPLHGQASVRLSDRSC